MKSLGKGISEQEVIAEFERSTKNGATVGASRSLRKAVTEGQEADAAQAVMDAWNAMASRTGLAHIRLITAARASSLRKRISQVGLEGMLEAIAKVEQSRFCNGENDRGWTASFDFILQQKSLAGLLEHGYAWKGTKPGLDDTLRGIMGDGR